MHNQCSLSMGVTYGSMEPYPIVLPISDTNENQTIESLVYARLGADAADVLAHGGVWVHGRRVDDVTQRAPLGATLFLHRPPDGCYTAPVIGSTDIWYEDKWLLVLNKQAGWYTTPTPWDRYGNIRVALTSYLYRRDGVMPGLHLAHQLDRDTSGILLCSMCPQVNAPLQEAFATGQIEKKYFALCSGEPAEDVIDVRTGHGRRLGGWCTYPLEEIGRMLPNGKPVRLAHTMIHVVQRMGDVSLVEAVLYTGRTHQIRLHLALLGHPIVGDTRYGGPVFFRSKPVLCHMLHAAWMRLVHPVTGDVVTLDVPLPLSFPR